MKANQEMQSKVPGMTVGDVLAFKAAEQKPQPRPLYEIAREIQRVWKPVYFAAKPYLEAMAQLHSVNDKFFMDDGRSIVLYFLGNAKVWRGEDARRIKAELKALLKR